MKTCPFCAEEIQDAAIKCKHCSEFLDESKRPAPEPAEQKAPWYFRKTIIIMALLFVGPFALPMIWWHPKLTQAWKIGISIIILALSWLLLIGTINAIENFKEYYKIIQDL